MTIYSHVLILIFKLKSVDSHVLILIFKLKSVKYSHVFYFDFLKLKSVNDRYKNKSIHIMFIIVYGNVVIHVCQYMYFGLPEMAW